MEEIWNLGESVFRSKYCSCWQKCCIICEWALEWLYKCSGFRSMFKLDIRVAWCDIGRPLVIILPKICALLVFGGWRCSKFNYRRWSSWRQGYWNCCWRSWKRYCWARRWRSWRRVTSRLSAKYSKKQFLIGKTRKTKYFWQHQRCISTALYFPQQIKFLSATQSSIYLTLCKFWEATQQCCKVFEASVERIRIFRVQRLAQIENRHYEDVRKACTNYASAHFLRLCGNILLQSPHFHFSQNVPHALSVAAPYYADSKCGRNSRLGALSDGSNVENQLLLIDLFSFEVCGAPNDSEFSEEISAN